MASLLFVAARMEKKVGTKQTPATSMILSRMLGQRRAEQCLRREILPGSTVQVATLSRLNGISILLTRCDHFAPQNNGALSLPGTRREHLGTSPAWKPPPRVSTSTRCPTCRATTATRAWPSSTRTDCSRAAGWTIHRKP